MAETKKKGRVMRRLMTGLISAAPLVVTWVILSFLFQQLSEFGRPLVVGLSRAVRPASPALADFIGNDALQSALAVVIVLVAIYLLGWLAERIAGRRLIALFDNLAQRIPIVETIYRATKRFLEIANAAEGNRPQRVVLISFPSPEMKTVGLLTRQMVDEHTGEELAVVYVPTTPNPTSGYLEILPVKDLIITDWSFDQAIAFIVTAGANAPENINYRESTGAEPHPRPPAQP